MAQTFIDLNGLAHAFSKVKALVATKANADLSNVGKDTLAAAVEEAGIKNYTHPTTSGNKHIPSGGSSGKILKWSADGTAVWGDEKSITVDSALSSSSTNPVQNKVVKEALDGKMSSDGGNMGGELVFNTSDGGVQLANPYANGRKGYITQPANGEIEIKNHVGSGNDFTALQLKPEGYNGVNFLRALRMSGGVQTGYDVLHTGNIREHAAEKEHDHTAADVGAVPTGGVDKDF